MLLVEIFFINMHNVPNPSCIFRTIAVSKCSLYSLGRGEKLRPVRNVNGGSAVGNAEPRRNSTHKNHSETTSPRHALEYCGVKATRLTRSMVQLSPTKLTQNWNSPWNVDPANPNNDGFHYKYFAENNVQWLNSYFWVRKLLNWLFLSWSKNSDQ